MSIKTVTIQSSDNVNIKLDYELAIRSGLIKGLLGDYKEEDALPLPGVRSEILNLVVEFLNHYKDTQPKEIPKPLPSANLQDILDKWDYEFINKVELNSVFDLINAANYMELTPILDLACAKIASLMKGKTAEEIRAMFNIECDLSEEEMKEYEEFQI
ncbi:MAG: SKP1 family protein [archaeon]|nr:SKP1 family protein [archaeon]